MVLKQFELNIFVRFNERPEITVVVKTVLK